MTRLVSKCETLGFSLSDEECRHVVYLSDWWYADVITGKKLFKARYPNDTTQQIHGTLPAIEIISAVVRRLVEPPLSGAAL